MTDYVEFNCRKTYHPGHYLKEMLAGRGGLSSDTALRMGIEEQELSLILSGRTSIRTRTAVMLSRSFQTGARYWIDLQADYDEALALRRESQEFEKEKSIFNMVDYRFFCNKYGLPFHTGQQAEQIRTFREFLEVSTLTILSADGAFADFRGSTPFLSPSAIINANALIRISLNRAFKIKCVRYGNKKFLPVVRNIKARCARRDYDRETLKEELLKVGVVLVTCPRHLRTGLISACVRADRKMVLLAAERRSDREFMRVILQEIWHILKFDYGASFVTGDPEQTKKALRYAERALKGDEDQDEMPDMAV